MDFKNELFLYSYIGIKFNLWEYEQEYRLIVNHCCDTKTDDILDLPYYAPFLRVTSVIMGGQLELKDVFHDLCHRHQIDLYQANYSNSKYGITLERVLDCGRQTYQLRSICKCKCVLHKF